MLVSSLPIYETHDSLATIELNFSALSELNFRVSSFTSNVHFAATEETSELRFSAKSLTNSMMCSFIFISNFSSFLKVIYISISMWLLPLEMVRLGKLSSAFWKMSSTKLCYCQYAVLQCIDYR